MPSKTSKRQTASKRSAHPLKMIGIDPKKPLDGLYRTFDRSLRFVQNNPMIKKLSASTKKVRGLAADKLTLSKIKKRNSGGTRKKRKTSKRKIKSGCN